MRNKPFSLKLMPPFQYMIYRMIFEVDLNKLQGINTYQDAFTRLRRAQKWARANYLFHRHEWKKFGPDWDISEARMTAWQNCERMLSTIETTLIRSRYLK